MTGACRVQEACQRLGISEPRFRHLREALLQGALASLEDRPAGRPRPPEPSAEMMALCQHVAGVERELQVAAVREEIALALPQGKPTPPAPAVPRAAAPKKNAPASANRRRRRCAAGGDRGQHHAQQPPTRRRGPARAGAVVRPSGLGAPGRHPRQRGGASRSAPGAAAARDGPGRDPAAAAGSAGVPAAALAAGHPPGGGRLLPRVARPGPDPGAVWPDAAPGAADPAGLGRGGSAGNARPGTRWGDR